MPSHTNRNRHHTLSRPQVPLPIAMVWNLAQKEKLKLLPQMPPQPQSEHPPVALLETKGVNPLQVSLLPVAAIRSTLEAAVVQIRHSEFAVRIATKGTVH